MLYHQILLQSFSHSSGSLTWPLIIASWIRLEYLHLFHLLLRRGEKRFREPLPFLITRFCNTNSVAVILIMWSPSPPFHFKPSAAWSAVIIIITITCLMQIKWVRHGCNDHEREKGSCRLESCKSDVAADVDIMSVQIFQPGFGRLSNQRIGLSGLTSSSTLAQNDFLRVNNVSVH